LNQQVNLSGADLVLSAPLPHRLATEAALTHETARPDSFARVYRDDDLSGREEGDRIRFEELPADIRDDLGRREQGRFTFSFLGDGRRGRGLLTRGVRGRLHTETVVSDHPPFHALGVDLRGYLPVRQGAQVALRIQSAAVSSAAPFYERLYLGGLYTVRGYASQSLSPPQGNLLLSAVSLELRSTWVGAPDDPKVASVLFVDAGWAGDGAWLQHGRSAAGLGYGLRVRVPWIHQVGLDIGAPLSRAVRDESFHANLSLGWTY
jgi:outer membrane protein assembly factor BamA